MKILARYKKDTGKIMSVESWGFPDPPEDSDTDGWLFLEEHENLDNAFIDEGKLVPIDVPRPSVWHEWDKTLEEWVNCKPKQLADREQQVARETTFVFNGHEFQVDPKSASLIGNRALKIIKRKLLEEEIEPFQWRLKDNTFYTFDSDEFLIFAEEVDVYVESVMKEKWNKKDTISGDSI